MKCLQTLPLCVRVVSLMIIVHFAISAEEDTTPLITHSLIYTKIQSSYFSNTYLHPLCQNMREFKLIRNEK
jgi:hypothetical protein